MREVDGQQEGAPFPAPAASRSTRDCVRASFRLPESEDGQEGERNGKEEGRVYFSLNFRIGRAKRIERSD